VSLGRIHARPSCTVARGPRSRRWLGPRAQRIRGPRPRGSTAHDHAGRGPCAQRVACACRAGLGLRSPRRHDGRVPTTVRLPAGHGGGGDGSPELLVDGEGEKTDSAAAFFRRGGATVAGGGGGPTTGRGEGEVSSMLHG
jgi:hypothetical protein